MPTFESIKNWFLLLNAPLQDQVTTWIGTPVLPSKKTVSEFQDDIFKEFQRLFTSGRTSGYSGELEIV